MDNLRYDLEAAFKVNPLRRPSDGAIQRYISEGVNRRFIEWFAALDAQFADDLVDLVHTFKEMQQGISTVAWSWCKDRGMHPTITAACLLANVFDVCHERSSIPLVQVRRVGEMIERRIKGVRVDWYRPSVMEAFSSYPNLFRWVGEEAHRVAQPDEGYLEDEFNFRLAKDVVAGMRTIIREMFSSPDGAR